LIHSQSHRDADDDDEQLTGRVRPVEFQEPPAHSIPLPRSPTPRRCSTAVLTREGDRVRQLPRKKPSSIP
jgi:hypothetical protein